MEYRPQTAEYRCQQSCATVSYGRRKRLVAGQCTCMKQGPCRGTCLTREVEE